MDRTLAVTGAGLSRDFHWSSLARTNIQPMPSDRAPFQHFIRDFDFTQPLAIMLRFALENNLISSFTRGFKLSK
jgi:hypothetical protein